MPPSSTSALFSQALETLPRYVWDYAIGLLTAILSEPITTSLFLGGVGLGLLTNALIGGTMFFLAYTLLRSINNIGTAIGMGSTKLARSIRPPPMALAPDPPSGPTPGPNE